LILRYTECKKQQKKQEKKLSEFEKANLELGEKLQEERNVPKMTTKKVNFKAI
jgi:hypothetical protein